MANPVGKSNDGALRLDFDSPIAEKVRRKVPGNFTFLLMTDRNLQDLRRLRRRGHRNAARRVWHQS